MIETAVYDTKPYDREYLARATCAERVAWRFHDFRLSAETAPAAKGTQAVCIFVNDHADRACLEALAALDVQLIALRCAGHNNVDLEAARALGLTVVRVPAYSLRFRSATTQFWCVLNGLILLEKPRFSESRFTRRNAAFGQKWVHFCNLYPLLKNVSTRSLKFGLRNRRALFAPDPNCQRKGIVRDHNWHERGAHSAVQRMCHLGSNYRVARIPRWSKSSTHFWP